MTEVTEHHGMGRKALSIGANSSNYTVDYSQLKTAKTA
jgi:hypothetical protein